MLELLPVAEAFGSVLVAAPLVADPDCAELFTSDCGIVAEPAAAPEVVSGGTLELAGGFEVELPLVLLAAPDCEPVVLAAPLCAGGTLELPEVLLAAPVWLPVVLLFEPLFKSLFGSDPDWLEGVAVGLEGVAVWLPVVLWEPLVA